jgi:PadR family transcriptional regulator PadR
VAPRDPSGDMVQGMLDMLILKALSLEPMHGWGITERIHQWSDEALAVNQGSLYPALYRLKRQGWIASDWKTTENNRRARYYSLTAAGRRQLAAEQRGWERLSRGIELALGMQQP